MRVGLIVAVVLATRTADATYSIVATDSRSRETGGAGTSCIGTLSARVIYGSVPGKGAVHAQAQLGGPGKAAAVMQLGMDIEPAAIITSITRSTFDGNAQVRQYGIVDLQGRVAGFSGTQTMAFSDDRQGQLGTFTYSVQGNILTGAAVLDQAAAAFEGNGCDLADRLMLALEAGAHNGHGDSRCTPGGIPSDSAFIEVDRDGETAGTFLLLEVTDTAPASPLVELRARYNTWRSTHPCPVQPADAGADTKEPEGGCGCAGSRPTGWPVLLVIVAAIARRPRRSRVRRRRGERARLPALLLVVVTACSTSAQPPQPTRTAPEAVPTSATGDSGTPSTGDAERTSDASARVSPAAETTCSTDADCALTSDELVDSAPRTYACCPGCVDHAVTKPWLAEFRAWCASSPPPMCPPIGCAMQQKRAVCVAGRCEAKPAR